MKEIERKFIMKGFPEEVISVKEFSEMSMELLSEVEIDQAYLGVEPEVRIHTARTANGKETEYRMTIKSDGTLVRDEIMMDITPQFYESAVKMLPREPIHKIYRKYLFDLYILEVCRVNPGTNDEFFYAEIEFETELDAWTFLAPEWMGVDVTEDERYKMKNIWKAGLPR